MIFTSLNYTILKYKLNDLSINLISILLGFFVATFLSTIPAQTGDSSIIAASLIVTYNEIISQIVYNNIGNKRFTLSIIKYTKIGIIYGLFVEAFKLGS
uniref:Uncharacterized protein ycf20 n=1 Tax=Riquetophycus sp. TaxID=1897556 RepID=A0A1C9C849_9FLOR|nr:hypothetical protein Riqu_074 [Riquetophycus sp.]